MSVTLVKHYNPTWPAWFEELRHRFDSVLSGRYCSIEHVGSTSVAGMTAKPIIDVDIVIKPQDFERTKDMNKVSVHPSFQANKEGLTGWTRVSEGGTDDYWQGEE